MASGRFVASLVCLVTLRLAAQEPTSGPLPGATLGKIPVVAVSGPRAGSEFDAAQEVQDAPVALLFVHEVTRNTAPMIGGFDRLALEYRALGLRTAQIRLAADRTEAEALTKRQNQSLKLHWPLLVSTDGAEGPGDYALNRRCTLTLVLARNGKVVRSLAFTDTGRQDLPKLRSCFEELTAPLPEDDEALRTTVGTALPNDVATLKSLVVELLIEVRRLARERDRARETPASQPMRRAESRKAEGDAPRRDR